MLSIASWAGSIAAAYYLYPIVLPYAKNYTSDDRIALAGSAGAIFLIALIIITFITTRIADSSSTAALARWTARLVSYSVQPAASCFWWSLSPSGMAGGCALAAGWITNAKSKPFLDGLVGRLEAVLPTDIEPQIRARITGLRNKNQQNNNGEQAPSDDAPAGNVTNN